MQINLDFARLAAGIVVPIAVHLASTSAHADSSIIYKCRQASGKLLYSDTPCDLQNSKKEKVLRADDHGRYVNESKYDPVENAANRELKRHERTRFFVPEAERSENVGPPKSAAPTASEAKQATQQSGSWLGRTVATIKRL